ncbi:MAG: ATP-binding protein [Nitrososphaeria archaeon]
MEIKEIRLEELDPKKFIKEKIEEIRSIVGENYAINALSGGVDSSTVTMLGHLALGEKLRTYFIDNGLMRENEPQEVIALFKKMGVNVILVDAKEKFFNALKGLRDPEEKREAITRVFYKEVFGKIVKENGIKFLLQGTNYTDVEETVAGIKRQHNVLEQLGIDTEKEFGYRVIEPLIQLRKPAIRKVAQALGLPKNVYDRMPFPGPALAARVIGEVTPERVEIIRKCTSIVEQELKDIKAFQYLAILHEDKVTGIIGGKRKLGFQVEIRCWESLDAKTATPKRIPYNILEKIAQRITSEVKDVVSVTYNITSKPPSTIEAV